jgi:hypothetical protein
MARKPTAADRPQFRRDMVDMMSKLDVQVGEVSPDAVILVSRGEGFRPSDNVLWELSGNKSSVRSDVVCSSCKKTVAMSNHTYERYTALDRKPRICCTRCVETLLKDKE